MPKWSFNHETDEFTCDALYFIQEGDDGPIKIGRGDPAARLRTLQIGNPRKLSIVSCIDNAGYSEAFWHKAFSAYSMRGEWFRPEEPLLTAIGWATYGIDWADEVPAPHGVDAAQWRDAMLDAFDWYQDLVWSGDPEAKAAMRAMNYAYQEAALEDDSCPVVH